MMNLNFPLLDQPVKIKNGTFFIIEDVTVFANVIAWFYRYEGEGKLKLFNDQYQKLKATEIMIVTDILGFDVNSSAMLKLIYADLEQQLNVKIEVKTKIEQLTTTLSELIDYELLDHDLDLVHDEMTILELFKVLGIKIETKKVTIFEKMLEILQVYKYLSKKKLLIFINSCAYLTAEEIEELQNYISLCNMDVLFLEPRKIQGIAQTILDRDYFLT
ncbi:CRISPR-associated protein Csn2 [Enterococcus villorum]|uniref:CRISPR-associated protein Csn2 n=2 Tax=Enterococcus villorum TaxID=112904 RepID=A0A511J3Z6_9ENTE|nr:CRISPR-associated protein Csn2 [Enterococcus villorum]